jgi:solute carrier family 25 citrate transporter 1
MPHTKESNAAEHSQQTQTGAAAQEKQRPKPTILQSIVTGSVAGATEVLADHPLWSMKTRMQLGLPFTLNPHLLYRGILPNVASMIPITALQVGLNRLFQTLFYKNTTDLSNSQRMTSAFVAGVGSALISCPTEMVMTYQGKNGDKFFASGAHLVARGGWRSLIHWFTGYYDARRNVHRLFLSRYAYSEI